MMQFVHAGPHPGKSSVIFLPMIDMNPSDATCIYSTLHFISDHAKARNTTPILTFDQPLWYKAQAIILEETENSELKKVIFRLGGLHTEMSFLGSIGHLMSGSSIEDAMEAIYASNTVGHILSRKAIARAVRAHTLIDSALNGLLLSELSSTITTDSATGFESSDSPQVILEVSSLSRSNTDTTLNELQQCYDDIRVGKIHPNEIGQSSVIQKITGFLSENK
jgi:hypothetical protein